MLILWVRGWAMFPVGVFLYSRRCDACGHEGPTSIIGTYRYFRLFRAYGVSWKYELLGLRCQSCQTNIRPESSESQLMAPSALPKSKAVPFADRWGLVLFALLYGAIGSFLFAVIPHNHSAWAGFLVVVMLVGVGIFLAHRREHQLNDI